MIPVFEIEKRMNAFMKPWTFRYALAASALAASVAPVQAHPSYAMFDLTIELVMTGVVERFDYTIPHSWLHLKVVDEDGVERHWALEMDGVPDLFRNGIMGDFVTPGETITVRANPMRGNRPGGLWRGSVDAQGNAYGEAEGLEPPQEGAGQS